MSNQQEFKYEYKLRITPTNKELIGIITDFLPLLDEDIDPSVGGFNDLGPILVEALVLQSLMITGRTHLISRVDKNTTVIPMSYILESIISCEVREYTPKK